MSFDDGLRGDFFDGAWVFMGVAAFSSELFLEDARCDGKAADDRKSY